MEHQLIRETLLKNINAFILKFKSWKTRLRSRNKTPKIPIKIVVEDKKIPDKKPPEDGGNWNFY